MDHRNLEKQDEPEEPRFLDFPHLPDDATRDGKPVLNKYSQTITKDHDFPGARKLLFVCTICGSLVDGRGFRGVEKDSLETGSLGWRLG